ncbi:MAG: hypothetical protein Q8S05_01620 [Sulfuricella sp.]|nr:hypothetical protein [Sulfuricella sp.]
MSWRSAVLGAALLGLVAPTAAEDGVRLTRWDGAVYGYLDSNTLRAGSVLNPGNRVARLSQRSATLEGRFNVKAESDGLRLTLRPIVLEQQAHSAVGDETRYEGYLSQWQLRLSAGEHWGLAAGRDLLNWGPAQFRSPASPFYFDSGRSNPMRELSGIDVVKVSWTPDRQTALHLARVTGSGHMAPDPDPWRNSWLLKLDRRGEEWATGLALAQAPGRLPFLGAHGQVTVSDALLLYAEVGSSTRARALQSPADAEQPFTVATESPRRTNVLAGAAYTFESGRSFYTEYLYHGHGFTAPEERAYFARAANAVTPEVAGLALGAAPPLLGRHYLHLVWQSNMMEDGGYWRLMLTHNFTDGGSEVAGYDEVALNRRVAAFVLGVLPLGGARQEFSALFSRSFTIGLKIFLP